MVKNNSEQFDKATDAFVTNLRVVLKGREMKRAALGASMEKAKKSVSMKTVYNVANKTHPPHARTLIRIAEKLQIPVWVMFIPNLPEEVLERGNLERFIKMVSNYFETHEDERHHVESTAATWAANRKLQDTNPHLVLEFKPETDRSEP